MRNESHTQPADAPMNAPGQPSTTEETVRSQHLREASPSLIMKAPQMPIDDRKKTPTNAAHQDAERHQSPITTDRRGHAEESADRTSDCMQPNTPQEKNATRSPTLEWEYLGFDH